MHYTHEDREEAYEKASAEVKSTYDSPSSGAILHEIAKNHAITDSEKYLTFVEIVSDTILGLRSQTELPEVFTNMLGLEHTKAVKLTSDLIEFLGGEQPQNFDADIAETEAALQSIPKVRTMANDVNTAQTTEPTHSSKQENILPQNPTPIPPPPQ